MGKHHFHINEIEWQRSTDKQWRALRWKEIFNQVQGEAKEFIFGYAELDAGQRLPLHTHKQAETDFIISGFANVRLGKRSVEVGPASALYFPVEAPHAIEALGNEPLCYIYTYPCEKLGQDLKLEISNEESAAKIDILNNPETRWAVAEEFEPWEPWEPSKGLKGILVRWLLGPERGNCREILAGTFKLAPGIHYTLHHHDGPEIYYGLSGRGIVYTGDSKVEVYPGAAVYLPGNIVHGADAHGSEPLRMYWLHGNESTGKNYNWTPVENIYTHVRSK